MQYLQNEIIMIELKIWLVCVLKCLSKSEYNNSLIKT